MSVIDVMGGAPDPADPLIASVNPDLSALPTLPADEIAANVRDRGLWSRRATASAVAANRYGDIDRTRP